MITSTGDKTPSSPITLLCSSLARADNFCEERLRDEPCDLSRTRSCLSGVPACVLGLIFSRDSSACCHRGMSIPSSPGDPDNSGNPAATQTGQNLTTQEALADRSRLSPQEQPGPVSSGGRTGAQCRPLDAARLSNEGSRPGNDGTSANAPEKSQAGSGTVLPGHPARSCRSTALFDDEYCRIRTLGHGSFSSVYEVEERRARNAPWPERWACKTLRLPCEGQQPKKGQSCWESVEKEIKVMESLSHRCILSLREYFVEGHVVHLILELVCGGELLAALAQRGSLPEEDARGIMFNLLDAVMHMHEQGYAHRDLKLENLLLVDPNCLTHIKLADFGMAHWFGDTSSHAKICGTPLYLAPEVLRPSTPASATGPKTAFYGKECDVWSCGVILYMILSGRPPFYNESLPMLIQEIQMGSCSFQDPVWYMVSDQAKDLVAKLLTVNPSERIKAADAICHPWIIGDISLDNPCLSF